MHSNGRRICHDSPVGTESRHSNAQSRFSTALCTSILLLTGLLATPVGALAELDPPSGAEPIEGSEPLVPESPVPGDVAPDSPNPEDPVPTEPEIVHPVAPDGVRDSVVRLYLSVFARVPDSDGQQFWVQRYMSGLALADAAGFFIESPEWRSTYGEVDDRQFVELLYQNVLHRSPDDEGWNYWAARLESGEERTAILLGFSESPEFITDTGTAQPSLPPFPGIPANSGSGRRIIYTNSGQRIWMINADETIHDSYLVSGRRNVPLSGTYSVYSKSPKAWAGHDGITMEHMVRFAYGRRLSIGFHSIPRYSDGTPMQTEDQLGTFRSGGCVRQRDDLALALYEWAPIGTTVIVLP